MEKNTLNEINELPESIQKRIILNYPPPLLITNNFPQVIGNGPGIQNIERELNEGCVHKKSLYNISKSAIVDGFNVRVIPKGTNIYKTFQGFLTWDAIYNYANNNKNKPSWLGNKYLCYSIAKSDWGSVVSFKCVEDIVLIDYFNKNNIQKIINLLEKEKNSENIIYLLKMASGYNISLKEQILFYEKEYLKKGRWSKIWIYTKPMFNKNSYAYCDPRYVEGFNPIGAIIGIHGNDIKIFEKILSQFKNIDGIIREQIQSSVDIGGVFYHEEFLLKGHTFDKLVFDSDDPLCWVNWKIPDLLIPKNGIHIKYSVSLIHSSGLQSGNENFKLVRFYLNNYPNLKKINGKYILSYNVHNFKNLNNDISIKNNIENIIKFIKFYRKNIKILIFQEVYWQSETLKNYFEDKLKKMKFTNIYYSYNGSNGSNILNCALLMVCCKPNVITSGEIRKINNTLQSSDCEKNIQCKNNAYPTENREQILINTKYGLLCFIHLHIGFRRILLEQIGDTNSSIRKYDLSRIINYNPDMIIGDFNFTTQDPEYEYLKSNGYLTYKSNENSTPYNRVDHVMYKDTQKMKNKKNFLVKINYSDHLPMFQEL
jgi:endonuclease/exonuclease/phosphatase family metal-dependent hydrolase